MPGRGRIPQRTRARHGEWPGRRAAQPRRHLRVRRRRLSLRARQPGTAERREQRRLHRQPGAWPPMAEIERRGGVRRGLDRPAAGQRIARWVELDLGARALHDDRFGSSLTYKAGGLFRTVHHIAVRGTYATAYPRTDHLRSPRRPDRTDAGRGGPCDTKPPSVGAGTKTPRSDGAGAVHRAGRAGRQQVHDQRAARHDRRQPRSEARDCGHRHRRSRRRAARRTRDQRGLLAHRHPQRDRDPRRRDHLRQLLRPRRAVVLRPDPSRSDDPPDQPGRSVPRERQAHDHLGLRPRARLRRSSSASSGGSTPASKPSTSARYDLDTSEQIIHGAGFYDLGVFPRYKANLASTWRHPERCIRRLHPAVRRHLQGMREQRLQHEPRRVARRRALRQARSVRQL